MDFIGLVNDPESGYREDKLKGDREVWYQGYLAGMEEALTDLDTAFDNLGLGTEMPFVRKILEDIGKALHDQLEELTLGSKAQTVVELLDDQGDEEEEEEKHE